MTGPEKVATGVGLWIVLAALVNAVSHDWLSAFTCLMIAAAILTWVFGRGQDRRERRAQRERADLVDRLERDVLAEQSTGEYVRNEEGFYVRRPNDADQRDRGAVGRDDSECDQH
ncbi:hypothetical protein SEA_EMIANNA_17 [Gordonia phage Emianna]|uniref:Uncharacterized protein n=3 Tax=Foxborovirus TaxID=2948710 RepID=A0A385UE71_9CAUD|nr:hypothetical protein KNU10_gp18 [Gordonia phage Foxboro]YP_010098365.1 hypothetical protein KNU11_gp17 [Gordonia phage KidneyBean]YP_010098905.1 hypothetical protein KNU15_gp17 [Gordonia phage Emianna]AYD84289.1 hypothetical protein SEA_KURT_17 [Gordonia phage Kurt]AYB69150.1 hypothetical protein SEA_FOXBORO_18 [Gordonia phage Foxboro]AYB69735.1 hypothetical protein SEA_KIDNEYBEAN_17 [Gordonia phage KidneyBean]AYD83402.1 hypothetical protein SEA_EMIANNA_17 [Gordonia phage Emianna]